MGRLEALDDSHAPQARNVREECAHAGRQEYPEQGDEPVAQPQSGDARRHARYVSATAISAMARAVHAHEQDLGEEEHDPREDQRAHDGDRLLDLRRIAHEPQQCHASEVDYDAPGHAEGADSREIAPRLGRLARHFPHHVRREPEQGHHLHDEVERHHQRVLAQHRVGMPPDHDEQYEGHDGHRQAVHQHVLRVG